MLMTQYGLNSCKRPPTLDILGDPLQEARLYHGLSADQLFAEAKGGDK